MPGLSLTDSWPLSGLLGINKTELGGIPEVIYTKSFSSASLWGPEGTVPESHLCDRQNGLPLMLGGRKG